MSKFNSREDAKTRRGAELERISSIAVECCFQLHEQLGPGLLESVYETILAELLRRKGLKVDRQKPIKINFLDLDIEEGFRADLVIEDMFIIEIKSLEQMSKVHAKQLLTYLRLMNLPLGLLMNFGAPTFKDGIKRIVNNHTAFASSRLRVNQNTGERGSRA
jgi:GxxExxY protein